MINKLGEVWKGCWRLSAWKPVSR